MMANDAEALGAELADLMLKLRPAEVPTQPMQTIAPAVHVAVPPVVIDAEPLAAAMAQSGQANADALAAAMQAMVGALAGAVVEAAGRVKPADLSSLTAAATAIAEATGANDMSDRLDRIASLLAANANSLTANTAALGEVAEAIRAQNDILARPKTVDYDSAGRIVRVKT